MEHAPRGVAFRLFGQVEAAADGAPFRLATPRKSLQILVYLLLQRPAPVARDFLAFTLWPDEDEEVALTRLRSSFSDLQRVLPPGGPWVTSGDDGVRWLDADRAWVDVSEFERLARDPASYAQAVALYRGHLAEALYDDWIVAARERLCSTYLSCLDALLSDARRRRAFAEALAYAQRILHVDPWREDVVRRVITTRYDAGDRAGALAEYRRFSAALREEMAVDPMPETVALHDAIARGAPVGIDAPGEASASRLRASHAFPFVGRAGELEALLERWMQAERGSGGIAFVDGEAGAGKTRLALELAQRVEERGARVLSGATGFPEAAPYQCIAEALRSARPLVASLNLAPLWLGVLSTLVPDLTPALERAPLPQLQPDDEQRRLLEAMSRGLAQLARVRPVLLVLEDVHWASKATLDAISLLARQMLGERLLIVATLRDDDVPLGHPLHAARRTATLECAATIVHLGGLDEGSIQTLLDAAPARTEGATAAEILARSNGNPLFATSLIEAAGEFGAGDVPGTIVDIVVARIARLSETGREALVAAALVGRRFASDIVREVLGWDGATTIDALDELIDRRIVRPATGRGSFDYAFVHQLVLGAVLGTLEAAQTSVLQRRIARVLEALYPERHDELGGEMARHYDAGGDARSAARWYAAAGKRALALGALDDATALLARGLSVVEDARLRIDLLFAWESLLARRGDMAGRMRTLHEAGSIAATLGDEDARCTVIVRRALCATQADDPKEVVAALNDLRERVEINQSTHWKARLNLAESDYLLDYGHAAESERHARSAREAFAAVGDASGEARALGELAILAVMQNRFSDAESYADLTDRAAARATDYESKRRAVQVRFMISGDEPRPARPAAESWLRSVTEAGDRRSQAHALGQLATTYLTEIDGIAVAAARRLFGEARRTFDDLRLPAGVASLDINSSYLWLRVGAFAEAVAAARRGVAYFQTAAHPRGTMAALSILCEALTYAGDPHAGREAGLRALTMARERGRDLQEGATLEQLAVAEFALGNVADAIAHAERAIALAAESGRESGAARNASMLALFFQRAGNLDGAVRYAERVPPDADLLANRALWPQRSAWIAADVFRAAGRDDEARTFLMLAHALLRRAARGLEREERQRFLALPWHREIRLAAARRRSPDASGRPG
jgi:DNA-binding SARP family transcriptional activator